MKTKLFIVALFTGATLMTSCSGGLSEESKKKVAAFDSSWSAMGTMAKAWGDSLNQAVALCETACKDGDAMECCEHLKGTKDSLLTPCVHDMTAFQEIKKSWDAEMPMWDELQKKLDALKEKVSKGEGTDKEVNDLLAELQAASDKGAAEMQPWIEKFNGVKMNAMKNMETCKTNWSNTKCADKKCADHKKKNA